MDWSSVQLRSLVELARRGTVTAAAQALGYTPGAVSQQLSALERAAGVPLLRKVGRRLELTDAGSALVRHAERMLEIEAEAVATLERSTTEIAGSLAIGIFATAAAEILPLALGRVEQRYPDLAVRSREMDVDEVYDAVASGAVDLALGIDYPDVPIRRNPNLRVVRLYRERFSLATPLATLEGVELIGIADTGSLGWILPPAKSHYGQAVRTVCRRFGVEPDVRHEVTDTAASLALVETGLGVTPVTDLMLRLRPSRLSIVRLAETFERHIVAIVRTSAERRPSVAALVSVLRELATDDTWLGEGPGS
ncbi:LysR substrate-binding domain-containing protein [Streptosporangium sp. NPDC006007]|uniref:LysR family transcriptional regulator n=1 Tax=Streptosporangium sp. NPDC006007 TaxID=3154575 RepID=UPI0033B921EF